TPGLSEKIAKRKEEIGKRHAENRAKWSKQAQEHWDSKPMTVPRLALEAWDLRSALLPRRPRARHRHADWAFTRRRAGEQRNRQTGCRFATGRRSDVRRRSALDCRQVSDPDARLHVQQPRLLQRLEPSARFGENPRHRSEPRAYRHGPLRPGSRFRRSGKIDGVVQRRPLRKRRRSQRRSQTRHRASQARQARSHRRRLRSQKPRIISFPVVHAAQRRGQPGSNTSTNLITQAKIKFFSLLLAGQNRKLSSSLAHSPKFFTRRLAPSGGPHTSGGRFPFNGGFDRRHHGEKINEIWNKLVLRLWSHRNNSAGSIRFCRSNSLGEEKLCLKQRCARERPASS